jgi:GMP synthase (glutamine-hydrolysing)
MWMRRRGVVARGCRWLDYVPGEAPVWSAVDSDPVKPVLLVRNDPDETFGVAPGALAAAGCDIRSVNMTRRRAVPPPLQEVAAVVVFGGTPNVDQTDRYPYLGTVRSLVREALERGVPYLGVCLGSQILARVLGREVVRAPAREIGFEPIRPTPAAAADRLLAPYTEGDLVVQWHEDTHQLPEGATLLATGDAVEVQAYRVGDLAWGIQFHQELDAVGMRAWIDAAEGEGDLEPAWGKSAATLRSELERHMAAHEERGRDLFRRFGEVAREHGA